MPSRTVGEVPDRSSRCIRCERPDGSPLRASAAGHPPRVRVAVVHAVQIWKPPREEQIWKPPREEAGGRKRPWSRGAEVHAIVPRMASLERALTRGTRRGERALLEFGDIVRETRVGAGLSQSDVGRAVGLSPSEVSRIERARIRNLSFLGAARLAAVLGLDLRLNVYPAGDPLRDVAHATRLRRIIQHIRPPLTYRVDAPLPKRADGPIELRAWDLLVVGHAQRTAFELEMRIRDAQATIRRHALKRRDDPVDRFVLAVADTRTNRHVLREHLDLFPDLPALRTGRVLAALRSGDHPPSGIILI